MRPVVSGSSGFVGRSLLRFLASSGLKGVAVSRGNVADVPLGWEMCSRGRMLSGKNDLCCDVCIHLEVKQHVISPTAHDIAEFEAVNIDGTQRWLEWCAANRVPRFVYFSSIKAVDPVPHHITDERANGTIGAPYGQSKWRAEEHVRKWAAEDPRRSALILRPAVVYGPGNLANVAAMVSAICRNRFFLVGGNSNVKSMVSVKNVVAAVAHLLQRMQPGSCEVYNVVDRESFTVRQIDAKIRASVGKMGNSPTLPIPIAHAAATFGDVFHRVTGRTFPINRSRLDALLEHTHFSCQKLIDTGFRHAQTTDEGLAEMVAWYQCPAVRQ